MPHISKENILELSSMSNEVKAYLEKLYPDCFENDHKETPLQKATRLYCRGVLFKNFCNSETLIDCTPAFFEDSNGIYYLSYENIHTSIGHYVFYINRWAEIIEY